MKSISNTFPFLLAASLLLSNNAWAQTVTFKKIIHDNGGNNGVTVIETPTGYIIAGGTGYNDDNTGHAIKLIKTDLVGNVLFVKKIWESGLNYFGGISSSMVRTSDGNFAMVGSIQTAAYKSTALLVKVDQNLDTIFVKRFNNGEFDIFFQCLETSDKGLALFGSSNSFPNKDYQFYLVKVDSAGDFLWHKNYGNSFAETGRRFAITNNNGFFLAGESYTNGNNNPRNPYWIVTDSLGQVIRDTISGTNGEDGLTSVTRLSDTEMLLYGYLNETSSYYAKTNMDGELLWTKVTASSIERDFYYQAKRLSDGNILVGGVRKHTNGPTRAIWLQKISMEGNLIWERLFGIDSAGFLPSIIYDFQETSDRGFIVTGHAFSFDSLTNSTPQGFLLMKLDSNGCLKNDCGLLYTGIEGHVGIGSTTTISVFPNPTDGPLHISYQLPNGNYTSPQIVISNLQGQLIKQQYILSASGTVSFQLNDQPAGIYIYQLIADGEVLASGKVVR